MRRLRIGLLLALAGCGGGQTVNGTLVLVEVQSDLPVPAQLDHVQIDVRTASGGTASRGFPVTAGGLVAQLGIVPEGKTAGEFTVTVTASAGGKSTLAQVLTSAFVPNEARKLPVFLGASCLTVAPGCPTATTCRSGACVGFADGVTLVPYTADAAPAPAAEGGPAPMADGPAADLSSADTAVDAADAAVSPDTAAPPDLPPAACGEPGQACCATATPCTGAATCVASMCQCAGPNMMCAGACVNPTSDSRNCRTCGHSCQGGPCTMSSCGPVMVASAQDNPTYLTADDQHLFWRRGPTNGGAIARIRKDGSLPVADLVSMIDGQGAMIGDGSHLFYFGNNNVWSCTVPSCPTPQRLAPTMPTMSLGVSIIDVTLNPARARLFWSDNAKLLSVPVGGGATMTHLSGNFPTTTMAIDTGLMYYVERDPMGAVSIQKLTTMPPPARAVVVDFPANALFPRQIGILGNRLLWVSTGSVNSMLVDSPSTTPPAPLATGSPTRMALEGTTVFWGDFASATSGRILSCSTSGCRGLPPTVLAATCGPGYVAADATAVYWICNTTGTVWKVAR